jgi:(2Fe-2S) ferredoxin
VSKDFSHTPECVFYVCCGSKCKKRGGKHLYKQLKHSVKDKHLKRKVQVIKTGCTDHCKRGPVLAVMPGNEWYFEVDEEKAMTLLGQRTVKV